MPRLLQELSGEAHAAPFRFLPSSIREHPDRAAVRAGESLSNGEMEGAMWTGGLIDWVILCSGYVLAAALFYLLGGFERAGEAIRRWGRSTTSQG